jgi:hypothetical protein
MRISKHIPVVSPWKRMLTATSTCIAKASYPGPTGSANEYARSSSADSRSSLPQIIGNLCISDLLQVLDHRQNKII